MERVASTDRRPSTKRDAIANDDDSASEEPVKKSAKNEEKSTPNSSQSSSSSTSFSEDVEFQQNLARTYERFRAAREASYRAKKLLDAKDDTVHDSGMAGKVSELSREIDSLKTEVAELRSKEIAANNQKNELSGKNHELNVEVNALKELNIKAEAVHDALVKVNDAREVYVAQLENSTVQTNKLNEELSRKNTALNEEVEAAKERAEKEAEKNIVLKKALEESRKAETAAVNREIKLIRENAALKQELEETKKKAEEDSIKDSARHVAREREAGRIKYPSHKLKGSQKREQSPVPMDEDQMAVEEPKSPAAKQLQQPQQPQHVSDDEINSALDSICDEELHGWLLDRDHMKKLLKNEERKWKNLVKTDKNDLFYLYCARVLIIDVNGNEDRKMKYKKLLRIRKKYPEYFPLIVNQLSIAKQSLLEQFARASKKNIKERSVEGRGRKRR